jgi:hypothetical protein
MCVPVSQQDLHRPVSPVGQPPLDCFLAGRLRSGWLREAWLVSRRGVDDQQPAPQPGSGTLDLSSVTLVDCPGVRK